MAAFNRPLSLIVGTAYFMEQLDSTIVAPAIPGMAAALQVDPLSLNLSMIAYLLCCVIFIPLGGVFSGRWGTRSVFKGALLLFIVSSALCGCATNLETLITASALQGVSGALMVPTGRVAIVHTADKGALVSALAWMITPAMLGPLFGPPLGGTLATFASWPWLFWINIPIGLVGYRMACRYFPDIRDPSEKAFDVLEWIALSGTLGSAVILLEHLQNHDRGPLSTPLLVSIFAMCLAVYWQRSRKRPTPLLDFRLTRHDTFFAGLWAGSLIRVGYGALPFLLPLLLQIGLGFTPLQSGWVLLASGAVAFVTKTQTTGLLRRYGFRNLLLVNGVLSTVALLCCAAFRAEWGIALITVVVSAGGLSRSIQFNGLAAIAYADMPRDKIGAATTLNTTLQQLAIMLGISIASLVVAWSAHMAHRTSPAPVDFSYAFVVVSAIAFAAVPCCLRVGPQAGRTLSGHREQRPAPLSR